MESSKVARPLDTTRLSRTEFVAMAGGALLALGLILNWYSTNPGNAAANIDGERGSFNAFEVHPFLAWLLLLAAISPFILSWIIARGHQLSWARGELTAVAAIAALGLIIFNGLISRPGDPSSEISLEIGWYLALLGALLIIGGSALRASETGRARKPPGTF
jgi:hypothetical protein